MKSSSFKDGSPWKKIYRSYQYFDVHLSKVALQEKLMHLENDAYSAFRAFAIHCLKKTFFSSLQSNNLINKFYER